MLLHICSSCGAWCDMGIAQVLKDIFIARAGVSVPSGETPAYDCPACAASGTMRQISANARLKVIDAAPASQAEPTGADAAQAPISFDKKRMERGRRRGSRH